MPFAGTTAHSRRLAAAVLALAAVLGCGSASAVLYKWVDANGRVTYSDQPPPAGVKAEVVSAPVAPGSSDAVRAMATQEADLRKREKERADAKAKADKARLTAAEVEQFCAEARGRLKMYQPGQNVAKINEKGEQVFLDDAGIARERERMEGVIRERCPG